MKTTKTDIILRIIVLPFFMGMTYIHHFRVYLRCAGSFLKYGGELIHYTDRFNRKTILDSYLLMEKYVKENATDNN